MWNNITCLSASEDLLRVAVADIASAGIGQVVLLGDVSDSGDPGMIAAAIQAVTWSGMRAWAVPGNHDMSVSQHANAEAVKGSPLSTVIGQERLDGWPDIAVCGHGLRSDDGRLTCEAIGLADPAEIRTCRCPGHKGCMMPAAGNGGWRPGPATATPPSTACWPPATPSGPSARSCR